MLKVKANVTAEVRLMIDGVCQTEELIEEHDRTEQELSVLAERLETLICENARVAHAYLKQENKVRVPYLE